ncbi:MAG: long-chain-fatty-acid--CoA ligase [Xylophilus ampelinus]
MLSPSAVAPPAPPAAGAPGPAAAGGGAAQDAGDRPWLASYPPGMPADIDAGRYRSLVALIEESFRENAGRVAYHFMGRAVRYAEADRASLRLAAYFQSLGLQKGDRVALMMPNVPQYPVAVAAALRAGLVVVNVNPLYTPRELQHQLHDSGAQAIVLLENFGATLAACIGATAVRHVVLCALGDMLGFWKGLLVDAVVRRVKKLVPPFELPGAVRFGEALRRGARARFAPPDIGPDDLALLQYTGGTTGVAKGAMLLHRNLVANTLQAAAWYAPAMRKVPPGAQSVAVCILPLYHIFAFNINMMLGLRNGGAMIMIPNPRDLDAVLAELRRHTFHVFTAVNTLFNGLLRHKDFGTVAWKHVVLSGGGGSAVQAPVAQAWLERTGCPIVEGYGLSETSPVVSCNPTDSDAFSATIGLPLPSTRVALLDDDGKRVPPGEPGEIAVHGPQVMAGYWQQPEETAKAMTADGYFRTGDIGTMDARGYFRIVDRKKDMILVSGFNVYPNEIEDVAAGCPGVRECAVVGVPDGKTGEAVKLVVVRQDPALTAQQVLDFCKDHLTGYKRPRHVEFRESLPKTPIGKVLRRALREPG